jgi:hypothetical protein
MHVEIQELHTEVEVTDSQSVLAPAVLAQVVAAVIAELDKRDRAGQERGSELDLRSVVEQQRDTGGR